MSLAANRSSTTVLGRSCGTQKSVGSMESLPKTLITSMLVEQHCVLITRSEPCSMLPKALPNVIRESDANIATTTRRQRPRDLRAFPQFSFELFKRKFDGFE